MRTEINAVTTNKLLKSREIGGLEAISTSLLCGVYVCVCVRACVRACTEISVVTTNKLLKSVYCVACMCACACVCARACVY